MKAFLLKVDEAQYIQWQAKAKAAHISMSEWIRMRCNGDTTLSAAPHDSPTVLLIGETTKESLRNLENKLPASVALRIPCKHGMLFCKKCK